MSEYQVPFKAWRTFVPVVQAILNSTPIARLGDRCPLTAFTSLPADNPLSCIKEAMNGTVRIRSIQGVRAREIMHVEQIMAAVENLHREVANLSSKSRETRIKAHNAETHVRACKTDKGDFVLRAVLQKNKGRKTSLRWRGPFKILQVLSDFLFKVMDLRSAQESVVHGSRLKFFRNSEFEITEETENYLAFQDGEYCVVDEIQDINMQDGEVKLLVKWRGFDDEEPGWESLALMREDVPQLVTEFLEEIRNSGTKRQRRIASTC